MKKIANKSKTKPKSLPLGDFLTKFENTDSQFGRRGAGDMARSVGSTLASFSVESHRSTSSWNRNSSGAGDRTGFGGRHNRGSGNFRGNRNEGGNDYIELPTAPRANRMLDDDKSIPHRPPYVAFINNLPFDANEKDVRQIFYPLEIKFLRLPREGRYSKRSRGFAYLEFHTRQELITVLTMEEPILRGRRIRIEVSNNHDSFYASEPGAKRSEGYERTNSLNNDGGDYRNNEEIFNMDKEFPALKPRRNTRTYAGGQSETGSLSSESANSLNVATTMNVVGETNGDNGNDNEDENNDENNYNNNIINNDNMNSSNNNNNDTNMNMIENIYENVYNNANIINNSNNNDLNMNMNMTMNNNVFNNNNNNNLYESNNTNTQALQHLEPMNIEQRVQYRLQQLAQYENGSIDTFPKHFDYQN